MLWPPGRVDPPRARSSLSPDPEAEAELEQFLDCSNVVRAQQYAMLHYTT